VSGDEGGSRRVFIEDLFVLDLHDLDFLALNLYFALTILESHESIHPFLPRLQLFKSYKIN
jgi:hypothetical protein